MKVFNCGSLVVVKLMNQEGLITCFSVRFKRVLYEITYYIQNEQKQIWCDESEFDLINGKKQIIGFKNEK